MRLLLISFCTCFCSVVFSQQAKLLSRTVLQPPVQQTACLPPSEEAHIYARAKQNMQQLRLHSRIPAARKQQVFLSLPLQQAAGHNDPVFFSILNYVDIEQNSAAAFDYTCGNRTYDGHNGIDFGLVYFPWQRMTHEEVQVVAAADGVIVDKADGDIDILCNGCGCDGNYILLRHSDNSLTAYFHLKKNTVTAKAIGQTVTQGELLAYIGSSGNSASPHLHFEVYSDADNPGPSSLIEPFFDVCNSLNSNSWWAAQENYYVPANVRIATHNDEPRFGCYSEERGAESEVFTPGSNLFLSMSLRDQLPGSYLRFAVYLPDGALWYADSIAAFDFQPQPTHLLSFILPPSQPGIKGYWRVESEYSGKILEKRFLVRDSVQSVRSGDWNTPLTWSCNCVPQPVDVVTIKSGHAVIVTPAMGLTECADVIQEKGGTLDVSGYLRLRKR